MYKEHQQIVLTEQAVGDEGEELKPGDVGNIVHVHPGQKAFVVEFMSLNGGNRGVSHRVGVAGALRNEIRPYARANCYGAKHALILAGLVTHAGELKTRQNLDDRTRRQRRLQKPPQPLRSRPLPLPSRPTQRRTPRLPSHRPIRRKRRNNGHATPRDAHRRRPIPPRIDTDATR